MLRDLYTNFGRDSAINFFMRNATGVRSAQLAAPFFTWGEPVQLLHKAGCRSIRLIVRLCCATTAEALAEARKLDGVTIRYFTADTFHAKFYILDTLAMLGSANLTKAGLMSNREVAITLDSDDEVFDALPAFFDDLWESASALTDDVMERFARWVRSPGNTGRESDVIEGIEPSSPRTVNVATQKRTRERTYLETFRREYTELILPAHREVQTAYEAQGKRHPAFSGLPFEYEIDRFLNWVRTKYTTDENLRTFPLRKGVDRTSFILDRIGVWLAEEIPIDQERIGRLERLRSMFASREALKAVTFEDLTDALLGSAAFNEQLRFTKGGQPQLVRAFQEDNDEKRVKRAFDHLAFGKEDYVRRTYDCIYSRDYKLDHFAKACVQELYGWVNKENTPPINGRTIKALRYLGFDVKV